jgi:hypothetical protein
MCLGVVVNLFIGAAILGIVIAVMERDQFPGWGNMVLCVLAAIIPATIINAFLPGPLFLVGLIVGAGCAGIAISYLCGMSFQRACIAAGIYLAIQTAISFAFYLMFQW